MVIYCMKTTIVKEMVNLVEIIKNLYSDVVINGIRKILLVIVIVEVLAKI